MARQERRKRGERGQALLEFVLVTPLVLLFLLTLLDVGIAVNRRIVVDHAAREGARFAAVGGHALSNGGTVATQAQIIAYTMSQGQNVPDSVSVCYQDANGNGVLGDIGDNVKVTVNYTYNLVTGAASIVGSSVTSIEMSPSASARLERNAVSPTACT